MSARPGCHYTAYYAKKADFPNTIGKAFDSPTSTSCSLHDTNTLKGRQSG